MAFTVLVTGFEPFGNGTSNPSEIIVRRLEALHERRPLACGLSLHATVLPVVGGIARGSARHALRIAIARCRPHAVICFGEAASRSSICVERVACNERTYRIADNSGARVASAPVTRGAPASLRSTAIDAGMLRAMRDAVRSFGASVRMSDDAGRFLCNEILFDCLHRARGAYTAVFVHVPQTPAQARKRGDCGGTPLPVAVSARAAVAAVRWIARR